MKHLKVICLMGLLAALVLMATPVFACDQCSGGEPGIVMALDSADVPTKAVQNGIEVTHAGLFAVPYGADHTGAAACAHTTCATVESATRDVDQSTLTGYVVTAFKADESAGVIAYNTAQGVLRHGGTA